MRRTENASHQQRGKKHQEEKPDERKGSEGRTGEKHSATMKENYIALRKILSSEGSGEGASKRAAAAIVATGRAINL